MSTESHEHIGRRSFLQKAGLVTLAGAGADLTGFQLPFSPTMKKIKITNVDSNFEREPLNPYRFKGSAITDSWQSIAMLESESGIRKVGLGTQGVLLV
ncbi:hypothetical protein FHS68_003070 [Dyadobacter arcticus]|uniref:Twin-arginine translocation signal domain-containing protein n=1 Tax=Dyadobacter arcticus TaxID=1078754 RepID=A0ABX0ULL8_9BACT|nr:hypothetical protein [Dyadobacter arcticus]